MASIERGSSDGLSPFAQAQNQGNVARNVEIHGRSSQYQLLFFRGFNCSQARFHACPRGKGDV